MTLRRLGPTHDLARAYRELVAEVRSRTWTEAEWFAMHLGVDPSTEA